MARGNHSNGVFIATAITSIADNTTYTDVTNFTSLEVPVWDVKKLMIQSVFTGGTSASGDVVYSLIGQLSEDGVWDTVVAFTLTAARNGTSVAVYESGLIEVQGYHSLKLLTIAVANDAGAITSVNLNWGKAYGPGGGLGF